jgi:cytochrome c oxidase subunit 3
MAGQSSLLMLMGMSGWFHTVPYCGTLFAAGTACTVATAAAWWRDCVIESDMGFHTEIVKKNLISGVWIFIVSEASVFFSLLWSCVHLGMSPNVMVQMQWPPVGIEAVGWEGRALVMSGVLAASYYSANVAMVAKDPKAVLGALAVTCSLGALFLADQYLEYTTAPFTISDGPYGTTFFMTTGTHGLHVLIGTFWLAFAAANYARYKKSMEPTIMMKSAVLYWHFVDLVWIGVYGIIYAAQL